MKRSNRHSGKVKAQGRGGGGGEKKREKKKGGGGGREEGREGRRVSERGLCQETLQRRNKEIKQIPFLLPPSLPPSLLPCQSHSFHTPYTNTAPE